MKSSLLSTKQSPFFTWALALALVTLLVGAPSAWAKERGAKPVVTYAGLKVRADGSAELRVELSKSAVVVVKEAGKHVKFLIEGAVVEKRNNLNPLQAQFFCVNLLTARLERSKGGIVVNINLRDAAPVTVRSEAAPQGSFLEFQIPALKTPPASCG